jgi:outer membrane protein assembly factor BamD
MTVHNALVLPGRVLLASALALVLSIAGGCAAGRLRIPEGTSRPDQFLFERGNTALSEKKWLTAREFYQTLIETYPQSEHRADAKLGLGDSYLGEGTLAAQVLAINEFREFLSFFPTHPRADYAQYKLAMARYYQMAKPGRDQTETREAIKEFELFFERFPNSALASEARQHYRAARDRLGQHEYGVGITYYRLKWYPGAIDRFQDLLKADPEFTLRDGVYFHLAESLIKLNRSAEALPLLEKLLAEFEQSEYLEDAQKRVAELKKEPADRPRTAAVPPRQERRTAEVGRAATRAFSGSGTLGAMRRRSVSPTGGARPLNTAAKVW